MSFSSLVTNAMTLNHIDYETSEADKDDHLLPRSQAQEQERCPENHFQPPKPPLLPQGLSVSQPEICELLYFVWIHATVPFEGKNTAR